MESFLIVGFIIVMIAVIYVSAKKNADKLQSENGKHTKLEHKDCIEESAQECIHIYGQNIQTRKTKTCKKCGHKNDKNTKRCSVCGTKLWL